MSGDEFYRGLRLHCLLYGNYFDLHKRLLDSLSVYLPAVQGGHIWLNDVCESTRHRATVFMTNRIYPQNWSVSWGVENSKENVPKYRAMRQMFDKADDNCKWLMWMDDDTEILDQYFFPKLRDFIKSKESENICYVGQKWWINWQRGQWENMPRFKWFKGLPPFKHRGIPGIHFAQGSLWLLRRDIAKMLDWPPAQLNHNGGDCLLAEAIRQQGLPFHELPRDCRAIINGAPRRGMSERPVGCV